MNSPKSRTCGGEAKEHRWHEESVHYGAEREASDLGDDGRGEVRVSDVPRKLSPFPRRPMFKPGSQTALLLRDRGGRLMEDGLAIALQGVLEPWSQSLLLSHPSHKQLDWTLHTVCCLGASPKATGPTVMGNHVPN